MKSVGSFAVFGSYQLVRKCWTHSSQVNAERGEQSKDSPRPRRTGGRSAIECSLQCVFVF